jgi:hypothetical protein
MTERGAIHTAASPQTVQPVPRATSQRDLVMKSLILCPPQATKPSEA